MSRWVEGSVVERRQWTEQLFSLRVDAPVDAFHAGQFTRLALDIDGERVARPYSYVNAPDESPLDFYYIIVPGGPLTQRMIELNPGDTIWVAPKAAGVFRIDTLPDAGNLWLLATGTALGPFLSILKTPLPWERFDRIVLVHAVRTAEELTYRETIGEIQSAHEGQFTMVPFVSREETDFAIRGRIPEAIQDGRLEEIAGVTLNADLSQVMICGNPAMVKDTSDVLHARGMKRNRRHDPGQITTENYWKG